MAITSRSNKFLRSPTQVPTNTSALLNNLEGVVQEEVLNVFKALVKDLDEYKKSMYGIRRRYDNMLFVYNSPTQKETDVVEALRMDKNGNFAIGTEYPIWSQCKVDVNGVLYAIPQWVRYRSTNNAAGAGSYIWDTTVYINNQNLYTLTTGNTRVVFPVAGHYYYNAHVEVDVAGLAGGQQAFVQSVFNGATTLRRVRFLQAAAAAIMGAYSFVISGMIQTTLPTDYIEIVLGGAAAVARLGSAAQPLTTLEIVKVN